MIDHQLSFQDIYDEFQPRIRRYLTRLTGENEGEDLAQEVFARINHALEDFRGESGVATWVYRIATNVARDRHRQSVSRGGDAQSIPLEAFTESEGGRDFEGSADDTSSEQQVIRQEMNGCIREIIATLPDDYQSVIILSELEGMKNAEIAEILGVSLQTVKIRLHRARAKLREALTSSCVFYRDERNEFACDRKNPLVKIEESR